MALSGFLDGILGPVLLLDPLWTILIISLALALLITLVTKFATKQDLMKQLKEETKSLQKQLKELKGHPEKAMQVQKKAMETNLKYMRHSMRATLITIIPLILLFGWLQSHLAFEPIMPGQEFSITAQFAKGSSGNAVLAVANGLEIIGPASHELSDSRAVFALRAKEEGRHWIELAFNDRKYSRDVLITTERAYEPAIKTFKKEPLRALSVQHDKLIVMDLFGLKVGWLGSYILFSIIFSLVCRKVFKVY